MIKQIIKLVKGQSLESAIKQHENNVRKIFKSLNNMEIIQ